MIPVVLASQSPSRKQILQASGIEPFVVVSHVDEEAIESAFTGNIGDLTISLSEAKARAVIDRMAAAPPAELIRAMTDSDAEFCVLIAGDSLLELDGRAIGKPGNAQRTREIWQNMAGRWTVLHSGHTVALVSLHHSLHGSTFALRDVRSKRSATSVLIGRPTEDELEAYIATEEPFHVAGALTIDGFGGAFVERLDGDHLTVLGLSLPVVRELVTGMGVFWPDLWPSGPRLEQ